MKKKEKKTQQIQWRTFIRPHKYVVSHMCKCVCLCVVACLPAMHFSVSDFISIRFSHIFSLFSHFVFGSVFYFLSLQSFHMAFDNWASNWLYSTKIVYCFFGIWFLVTLFGFYVIFMSLSYSVFICSSSSLMKLMSMPMLMLVPFAELWLLFYSWCSRTL